MVISDGTVDLLEDFVDKPDDDDDDGCLCRGLGLFGRAWLDEGGRRGWGSLGAG